ncbi:YkgJ family cysteine cluster protein [Methanocaldococcus sp.]
MKWEITFNGITYRCINCAYCCSCEGWRIYLNYFDVLKLKDYKDCIERCKGEFKYRLKINERGCILLNNNLCRVHLEKGYEFKPLMCKIFPFSSMVKWNGTPLLIIKHYCKGICKGETDKKVIKEVIKYIKELYFDNFEEIIENGMEHSSKTLLYKDFRISWEEREEFGRYIFSSKNFDEMFERCKEIFGSNIKLINVELFKSIKNNIAKYSNQENEEEIIRYLLELNRREHFRKIPFYEEVEKLLKISQYLSKFKNVLRAEGNIDKKLFIDNTYNLK